jgi:hypothetical protein
MTIDEIGEAFDKRLSNLNRLDRFLFSRRADILETIGEQTFMIISASPTYLREEIILDIHDAELQNIMENPPRFQNTRGISCGCPYPTVNGLRADNHAPFGADNFPVRQYLEVFTNGYIEFAKLIKKDAVKGIAIRAFVEPPLIVDFVGFIRNVYERYVPLTPLTVKFSILNAKGIWLATNEFSEDDINVKWQKEHLDLGGFFTDNISVEGKLLGKEICDRLWQCFHHEKCFLIDESMTFRVPH